MCPIMEHRDSLIVLYIIFIFLLNVTDCFTDFNENEFFPEIPSRYRQERDLTDICLSGERCFDGLGCFPCQYKFHVESPEEINMVFYLHTDSNTTNQTVFYKDFKEGILRLRFDTGRHLWVIIHGFEGQWPLPWIHLMTTALLSKRNNVLIARWSEGTAYPGNYPQACSNGRIVGAMTGRFLKEMKEKKGLSYDKTSLIGFSLGVPVAGEVGEWLNGSLAQIVGLDHAGKYYEDEPVEDRLDPTDAKLVQVIHTHGAPLSQGGLGTMQAMGHVDFYVNGGLAQPGCPVSKRTDFSIKKFYNIIEVVGCNHLRAPALFTDSITNSCKYKAYPCESENVWREGKCFSCGESGCPNMGYQLDPTTKLRGKFFLSTLVKEEIRSANYCGKNYRINLVPDREVKGKIKITLMDGQNVTRRANFQGKSEKLPTFGKSVILAAPFDSLTGARIYYDRHNILVSRSHEIFGLHMITVTSDTGQRFGSNCTAKIKDDYTSEVDLYKGFGYGGVLGENTRLNLSNAVCDVRFVSGTKGKSLEVLFLLFSFAMMLCYY